MATVAALAIKTAHAIERLNAVAEKTGHALTLPMHLRDTIHLQAAQLDTLAAWAETAFGGGEAATVSDETFGAELSRRMDEHGVTLNSTKADIVAFLEVHLGNVG